MASIDAFRDLAAREPASNHALRASLRRLRPSAVSASDRATARQRALILIGIALLHVLMLFALRAALQPPRFARAHDVAPLQITFIERRPVLVIPKPIVAPSVPHPRATATPQRFAPRSDELQAVTIAPRTVPVPVVTAQPKALLYNTNGALLVPAAPASAPSRDLLAHRSVTYMLPGGSNPQSTDFHVRDSLSPQKVVEGVGALLFGGGPYDPCPDIAKDEIDINASAKEREQAEERDEKSCEAH